LFTPQLPRGPAEDERFDGERPGDGVADHVCSLAGNQEPRPDEARAKDRVPYGNGQRAHVAAEQGDGA
jgi:hypothetical protein